MPSFVKVFSDRSSTQENTMLKACIGGALVAMAVWLSPPGKEASQVVYGGTDCSGQDEPFDCEARKGRICSAGGGTEYVGVAEGARADALQLTEKSQVVCDDKHFSCVRAIKQLAKGGCDPLN